MDLTTKSVIEGVDITIYKGTSSTTTNKSGYFQLNVSGDDSLLMTHPDYQIGLIAVPKIDVFIAYLDKIDSYPIYLDGYANLYTYLARNLKFGPRLKTKKNEGVLLVQVSIDENGKLDSCQLLNDFIEKYEKNALDVFARIPGQWSPSLEAKQFVFPLIYKFRSSSAPIQWPQLVLPEAKIMEAITIYAEDL